MAKIIKNKGLQVRTSDGRDIYGTDPLTVEMKDFDTSTKSFWAIASTSNEDRDKDIIPVEEWDIKTYKEQPRGLWSHDYFELPIFRSEDTKIDKKAGQLIFRPIFANHQKAADVFNLFYGKFLNAFSVGFIPKDFEWRDPDQHWFGGKIFKNVELLEISAVNVPSNPGATVMTDTMKSLINEEANLITLGYTPDTFLNESAGYLWTPTSKNLDAFKDPRTVVISKGVQMVSAIPLYEESELCPIVGYKFDVNLFPTTDDVFKWLANKEIATTSKFYQVKFSENDFVLDLSEEMEENDKLYDTTNDNINTMGDNTKNEAVNTDDNIEDEEEVEEDGCGSPKKPKKDNEDLLKSIMSFFDNYKSTQVDLISELKNEIVALREEIKSKAVTSSEGDDELIEFKISEFPPVSQEDNSEKFVISDEEFGKEVETSVDEKTISNISSLFEEIFNSNSGKLE